MSSVVFATVCLIFVGLAVVGVLGYILGHHAGRLKERDQINKGSFNKLVESLVQLTSTRPPAPEPKQEAPPPRSNMQLIRSEPVQSGIYLGDDPADTPSNILDDPRTGVAASIPMTS